MSGFEECYEDKPRAGSNPMNEQLIAELEKQRTSIPCYDEAMDLLDRAAAALRTADERDLLTAKQLEACHNNIAELQLRWRRKAVAYDYLYHAVLYSTTLTESNGHKSYEDIVEEINAMLANGQFKEEVQIDDGFAESYVLVELDEIAEKDTQIAELQAQLAAAKKAIEWMFEKSQGGLPILLRKIEREVQGIEFSVDKYTIHGIQNISSGFHKTPISAVLAALEGK